VWLSATVVLIYILLGGLTSAIYNEVLQFFLIVFGFAPLVFLGLKDLGGWQGLTERLTHVATAQGFAPQAWSSTWSQMGDPTTNPMGVEWFGVAMGLGFVLSFGYWCTDFLVVQRAMAADSMSAARRTPLIAAVPKMLFPFLVIVTGHDRHRSSLRTGASGFVLPHKPDGTLNYDLSIPMMLSHYFPHGMLGPGAHGAAGQLHVGDGRERHGLQYRLDLRHLPGLHPPRRQRSPLPQHGTRGDGVRDRTVRAAAYVANHFNNIMDMLQLLFAFVECAAVCGRSCWECSGNGLPGTARLRVCCPERWRRHYTTA